MSNYSKNARAAQRNTNRYKDTKDAQKEWHETTVQLLKDKKELSYECFTWDAFLELNPEVMVIDVAKKVLVTDLQVRYKDHVAKKATLWAEDDVVEELNKKHAIMHTDQTSILTEKINALGNHDFVFESRQSFKTLYENQLVFCSDDVWRSKGDIWLKHPERRTYRGVTFNPTTTEHVGDRYNLWTGFKRNQKEGDCSLYWEHVERNICGGNKELHDYVRKWLAYIVQYPHKLHTALVLCGSQGVGKNSFVDPIGELFGQHYTVLSSMHELVSNFNYHLKHAVFIHANEALWGGHKKDIGTVKAMITDATYLIEGKGKDRIMMPNFRHLVISSNEAWPVHIDPDDRRFVVIQVSDARKEDHLYFKAISTQLNDGGYEALLYDLLHEDLTDFDPRRLPASNNAFDIKMLSADSAERYIYEVLVEGGFSIGGGGDDKNNKKADTKRTDSPAWQGPIPKEDVYADYSNWCSKTGEGKTVNAAMFGRVLKKLIPSVEDTRCKPQPEAKSRIYCYEFPSLEDTRKEFCKSFKAKYETLFGPSSAQE